MFCHVYTMIGNFEACRETKEPIAQNAVYRRWRRLYSAGNITLAEIRIPLTKFFYSLNIFSPCSWSSITSLWSIFHVSKNNCTHCMTTEPCAGSLWSTRQTQSYVNITDTDYVWWYSNNIWGISWTVNVIDQIVAVEQVFQFGVLN